ncbi:hypothetical protein SPRG_05063 [Saprolegnia parasitica CBS 223.65]|uniref:Uncharacterized protein n=1 Tax=Saprolegnia parasitica (strain CBS 223.65) TaxID=695850 RepID=A0A067CU86_SAPPC|nr:hypothetical protein SPRG_05063 [Saprolegnia parasitica CBS 223.65]KDO30352.1 hypothetical protein SPRG_05063 [Saprolegnia parasitica CBS 223.65]|eukprot:XP_012198962.1 hypothetical protein SPRG_05063 [Saprolegnia parasitica CBS 223.65]
MLFRQPSASRSMARLAAREDACKLLAQSLNEKASYDELMDEHRSACQCWSVLLEGLHVPCLDLPHALHHGKGSATKRELRDTMLWLHPMTLQLCFSNVHEFHARVPRLPLAHVRFVQSGRVSSTSAKAPPLTPYPCLSLTTWHDDVVHIGFATAQLRDYVVKMLREIVQVVDVMARVQDHVAQHLKRRDSVGSNSGIAAWTPADLEMWLHGRQLAALYVPLYSHLAHAFEVDGDAYERFLYLSDETIQTIIANESNQEGAAVAELRTALGTQLQLAREAKAKQTTTTKRTPSLRWPKRFAHAS